MNHFRYVAATSPKSIYGYMTILGIIIIAAVISACSDGNDSVPQERRSIESVSNNVPAFVDIPLEQVVPLRVTVDANMTLDDGIGDSLYKAQNVLNDSRDSVWAAKFGGSTPCLTFGLQGNAVKKISIANGNQKKSKMFVSNARAKTINLTFVDVDGNNVASDSYGIPEQIFDGSAIVEASFVLERAPNRIGSINLCVTDIYKGERWENDVFITRVSFFGK